MKLLEVRGMTKRFGGLVANDRIDLDIEEGEIVGLIGPNGSGKSTFFNCISGFYAPDGGMIRFRDEDITGKSAHEICRKGIARTFQLVRIFKDMTVLDNVMVGAFLRSGDVRAARRRSMEILELTGLSAKSRITAAELTIPDQKRLELARALATEPQLLMLDEVMAGLTPKEVSEAVDLVRSLSKRGITLFIVEHVMEAVMPISTKVVVFDSGRKIVEDIPEKVVQNEEVIKAYLGERYHAGCTKHQSVLR